MLLQKITNFEKSIVLCFFLLFIGCSKENNLENQVNIRLHNISSYTFTEIIVDTSTGKVAFGSLNAGETSVYKQFDTAYSYAFIELKIEDEIFTLQPIDYVGEEPLKGGNYTYKIDANDSESRYEKLTLTLTRD